MTVNAKDFPIRFSASDRDLSLCAVAPFLARRYNKIATIGEKFVLYASPSADAVDDTCKMTVQVCRHNSEDEPDSFFHLSAFDEDRMLICVTLMTFLSSVVLMLESS